jgi:rhodanese-related sulfurtransferase
MKPIKTVAAFAAVLALAFASQASAEGNRYGQPRVYHSEMSVAEAYLAMEHSKGWDNRANRGQPKPVLVDVRTLREYAAGHPADAHNIPFPNIYVSGDQDPAVYYWEVYNLVNGNLDTPIMLLCRTGNRSIRAGNILADPLNLANDPARVPVYGGLPFTNVRNIWEGFVGLHLFEFASGVPVNPPVRLDLNGDGLVQIADTADVYVEVTDSNPDKDGWRNFAGLPWTTQIRRPLTYLRDPGQYQALNLTPVQ